MLHCSMTHILARTRAYQYFCFLLSHLSQPSQQHNKNLIINTINSTSKWQTTHFAVTLLSRRPSYTTTPPHWAKFAVTLLSHYCHTTITEAISFPKINFFPQRISSFPPKLPLFSRKHPIFSRTPPLFSRKCPTFPEKSPSFSGKSGTSSKKALTLLRSPVTDVTEKNTKLCIYARAKSIASLQKIKRHALSTHFENLSWQYQLHPKKKVQFFTNHLLIEGISRYIVIEETQEIEDK